MTVTRRVWEQATSPLVRNTTVFALALLLACQSPLLAASGISDIPATRACWLRWPYALSKCYSPSGRTYHADLFVGLSSQSGDMWHYDGIFPGLSVASNISQVAITSRYIIVKYAGSEPTFGVIDTQRYVLEPVQLESWAELRQYLEQQGVKSEAFRFQDFEEIYRERNSWWKHYTTELFALFCLVFALAFVMVWRYRRTRGSALRGRLLWLGLPFLLAWVLDWFLTLHGQSAEYWAGNYDSVNEMSPYFRGLLMIHPLAFITGNLVWAGLILELLVLLPEVLAVILFIFVVDGHMSGAYSWMAIDMTVGRYQFGMVTNLAIAILLGVALYRSQPATVQKETSAGTLRTWLRYGMIALLSCAASAIVFAPW